MKQLCLSFLFCIYLAASYGQDFALKQLEQSSRHSEWVEVMNGSRKIKCFVVYPEVSAKTTAVIAIHENKGLTDWVRSFADQLAAAGYVVVAPDLLSDFDATHKKTGDFESSDAATKAIYALKQETVTADLNAVQQYAAKLPAANGKTASIGFCWGGGQSFAFATSNKNIKAAMVFYGTPPEEAAIKKIGAPVYGFYGGNDQRINATIPATDSLMKLSGKTYNYKIYPGAGHAYMRSGDDPNGSSENKEARNQSWMRIKEVLGKL